MENILYFVFFRRPIIKFYQKLYLKSRFLLLLGPVPYNIIYISCTGIDRCIYAMCVANTGLGRCIVLRAQSDKIDDGVTCGT